jgi:ligand-binding sensor domain-containing protein
MIRAMKKYVSQTHAFTLFVLIIFGTSCNGQVQKERPKEEVSASKIRAETWPKLIRTQGSKNGDNVNSSLQDRADNLWFGTTNEGLYKYDGKAFTQFTVANGLISNAISFLLEDRDGRLWIGTDIGVCVYDGKTFLKVEIPLRKDMPPNSQRNTHNVFSIMQDKRGKLWFATIDGVYIYNGKTFSPFIIKEDVPGFMSSNHNVEYILEDKGGNIWFGGRNNEGVFRYDGKSIANFRISEQKDFNWAWPALQDKNGSIWFNNWSGAYRFDGRSFTKLNGLSTAPVNPITRIIEDKKGNLWFGGSGGIWQYNGKSLTHFTVKDGFVNNDIGSFLDNRKGNEVWSILEDKTGTLWIGTRNTGLYRYDGKSIVGFSE